MWATVLSSDDELFDKSLLHLLLISRYYLLFFQSFVPLSFGEFKRSGLDPEELDFYNHLIVFHSLSSAKIYFHG